MTIKQTDSTGISDERPRLHTFLLCCGIIGTGLFALVNFTLAAISPDYDIVRQPVGDLQLESYGWIQSANFILAGFFMIGFGQGLRKEMISGLGAVSLPVIQTFMGVSFVLLGILVYEPLHSAVGLIAMLLLLAEFVIFACRFSRDPRWKGWATYTILSAALMIMMLVLDLWSRMNHNAYTGIFERAALLIRVMWTLFFTVRLLAGVRLRPIEESDKLYSDNPA
jgi:hypothetical protein